MTAFLLFLIACLLRAASFRKSFACSVPFPHPEAPLAPGVFLYILHKKKKNFILLMIFSFFLDIN